MTGERSLTGRIESRGIAIEKHTRQRQSVGIVGFTVEATGSTPTAVRFADRLPPGAEPGAVRIHPDHQPRDTTVDGGRVYFEVVAAPDSPATIKYGVRGDSSAPRMPPTDPEIVATARLDDRDYSDGALDAFDTPLGAGTPGTDDATPQNREDAGSTPGESGGSLGESGGSPGESGGSGSPGAGGEATRDARPDGTADGGTDTTVQDTGSSASGPSGPDVPDPAANSTNARADSTDADAEGDDPDPGAGPSGPDVPDPASDSGGSDASGRSGSNDAAPTSGGQSRPPESRTDDPGSGDARSGSAGPAPSSEDDTGPPGFEPVPATDEATSAPDPAAHPEKFVEELIEALASDAVSDRQRERLRSALGAGSVDGSALKSRIHTIEGSFEALEERISKEESVTARFRENLEDDLANLEQQVLILEQQVETAGEERDRLDDRIETVERREPGTTDETPVDERIQERVDERVEERVDERVAGLEDDEQFRERVEERVADLEREVGELRDSLQSELVSVREELATVEDQQSSKLVLLEEKVDRLESQLEELQDLNQKLSRAFSPPGSNSG